MRSMIILVGLVFLLTSCKLGGTNSGNPQGAQPPTDNSSPVTGSPGNPLTLGAKLSSAVCVKLSNCFGGSVVLTACFNSLLDDSGATSALNIDTTNYPTLRSFNPASGSYDETVFNNCLNEISNVNCASSPIQDAFDSNAPNPYSDAETVFLGTPSCKVF